MSRPKISILLPAYKSKDLISKIFLPSFRKNCSIEIEVIIYDNGGNGIFKDCFVDTPELEIEKNVRIIGSGKNIGLNAALNECAKVATGEWFYLPHTDMYLMPGWDTALLEAAKNHPPTSLLLCSRSIESGYSHIPSQIRADYGNEWHNFQEDKLLSEYTKFIKNNIVVNARMPFFLHRNLWQKLGGVDENYFSYCTDDDLIQDCYDKGVRKFWMVYNSLVYHLQGKSNNQQSVDKDSNKPYEYFVNKWKEKYPNISHPAHYHPKIIPFETKIK